MPKFKAEYLFNKIYDFEGVKEIEAKDIKEAIEKFFFHTNKEEIESKQYIIILPPLNNFVNLIIYEQMTLAHINIVEYL